MVAVLETRRDPIAAPCARRGVARLETFGSALGEGFSPGRSDIGLLVEFLPMDLSARVDAYFGLLSKLRDLLQADIDLVMAVAVRNPHIARFIERTKQLRYAA